jgi:hypothetical protein
MASVSVVLLQNWTSRGHEEVRQREEKRVGGGRRGGFTRWSRNHPAMLADVRVSVDEFRRIGEDLREGEKEGRGRYAGAFYRRPWRA